jgi:hypothetical protein
VNPDHLRKRDIRREEFKASIVNHLLLAPDQMREFYGYDSAEIFAYSKGDLERVKRDFTEATGMMVMLQVYLKPYFPDGTDTKDLILATRAQALDALSGLRLFQEAADRARGKQDTPEGTGRGE